MGLFEKKKKDAERCPICGKEISFFSGLVIADGTICDDCEKMVRGQFNIEEYYGRENWKISTSDPLKAMTVEELKDMINEKKAEQTQVVEEIGGDYAAIAKVEKTFGIAPKATDVGLKRAKALKNRIVATSYIMSGEFSRGDAVTVSFDGADMTTTILDVIECSSSSAECHFRKAQGQRRSQCLDHSGCHGRSWQRCPDQEISNLRGLSFTDT